MARIVKLFKTEQDNVVKTLEDILAKAKNGEIKSFVIASEMQDGAIGTAWVSCDLPKRQNLLAHMQVDIIAGVIIENY